jgi:hypothetical protein
MNEKNRLAGRFLPSRVYARWRWSVRFGLVALPLILFFAGSIVVYLTPSRYRSTAVFEYLGKRTPAEAMALLKSQAVISRVVSDLKLSGRFEVDSDTAARIVSRQMKVSAEPGTGLITLRTTALNRELARDLAVALPEALDSYEKSRAATELENRAAVESQLAREAEDIAVEKRKELTQWLRVHGDAAIQAIDQLDLDELRGDWEHAVQRVREANDRRSSIDNELAAWKSVIAVHTQPMISQNPVGKGSANPLGRVVLEALVSGLVFALAVPYLLEFAFPRRRPASRVPREVLSQIEEEVAFCQNP